MRSRILQLVAVSGMLFFLSTELEVTSRAAQDAQRHSVNIQANERRSGSHDLPPVIVDGATAPEGISDDLAYHLFLSAIALPASASDEEKRGRDGVLERVGLSREDARAFVGALANVKAELDEVSRERNRIARSKDAATQAHTASDALKRRETEIIASARVRLDRMVSAEGLAYLDEHIRTHVKRRIKIYGL